MQRSLQKLRRALAKLKNQFCLMSQVLTQTIRMQGCRSSRNLKLNRQNKRSNQNSKKLRSLSQFNPNPCSSQQCRRKSLPSPQHQPPKFLSQSPNHPLRQQRRQPRRSQPKSPKFGSPQSKTNPPLPLLTLPTRLLRHRVMIVALSQKRAQARLPMSILRKSQSKRRSPRKNDPGPDRDLAGKSVGGPEDDQKLFYIIVFAFLIGSSINFWAVYRCKDIIMMSHTEIQQENDMKVLSRVSEIMEGIITELGQTQPDTSLFTGNTVPDITIKDYLIRIKKHCRFSADCLIMALMYIDRYTLEVEDLVISMYNVHRLLLVTVLAGSKYHDDFYFNNKTYAFAGGITPRELNELELHLLVSIDFNLYIDPDDFEQYKTKLLED